MAPDTMQVRLHLRLIRVLAVVVDKLDELVVAVCSTRSWSRCPHCGFRCRRVHDTRLRRIRDLPVSGRAVTLEWQRRRFTCDGCGVTWRLTRSSRAVSPAVWPGQWWPMPE